MSPVCSWVDSFTHGFVKSRPCGLVLDFFCCSYEGILHSQVQGIVEAGCDEKRFDLIDEGDMLVAVNQIPTVRLSLDEVKSLVQGPPGTAVDLSFVRLDGEGRKHQVEVRARRHFELDDADLASAGLDHAVPASVYRIADFPYSFDSFSLSTMWVFAECCCAMLPAMHPRNDARRNRFPAQHCSHKRGTLLDDGDTGDANDLVFVWGVLLQ